MRAIVTGGAGFIGSHLVDALVAHGDEVVAVDSLATGKRERVNEGAELVVGDIRDGTVLGETFREAKPDVCFHLAAQVDVRRSVEEPVFDGDVNVLGTIGVLEAARARGTQVVFSSTGGAIYGECDRPADEDSALQPISPYGTSKLAGEEYLRTYNRLYGTQHVALRYANVYGPRQDPHGEAGVVAIFFGRIASGERPRIFGNGSQTRDYVYVGDVVQATLHAAGKAGRGVFNVGTGRETSVVELYEACRLVSGSELEPEFADARLGELARSVLDPARAGSELGFRAEVSLEDGLARTWDSVHGEGEERAGAK
ncbi:MAG TPA: NAD-dependent epimerase/dehydratase family protein [Gaiellaceae bacterium]|nr:NAD-dependent epimerase/dehydratase family protein [Gaiellaceae bacterium]